MTGAEHYAEAERLIVESEGIYARAVMDGSLTALEVAPRGASAAVDVAQVHATLALAAATAHNTRNGYARVGEYGDEAGSV